MKRREFLKAAGSLPLLGSLNGVTWAATATAKGTNRTTYSNLLVLIELRVPTTDSIR